MKVRHFNPAEGQAFQGDIAIVPIPAEITISTTDEIRPADGRLTLQEGEVSGHHHVIELQRRFRLPSTIGSDPALSTRDVKLRSALRGGRKASVGAARMFRDPAAVNEMVRRGVLTRADLAIGCLVVEDGPIVIAHLLADGSPTRDHDAIKTPPGRYYIGRQIESAGAEERQVRD